MTNIINSLTELLLKAKTDLMSANPNSVAFDLTMMKVKELEIKLDKILLTADL